MKLRLLVTAVVLSATAYAQKPKEVVPSYTTEPVTYQAAHCPDGYQLQRWEDHDMAMMVATIGVYSPSGYYPVWDGPPAANPHPDKCVEIGITIPSQSSPVASLSGSITSKDAVLVIGSGSTLSTESDSDKVYEGRLVIHRGKNPITIPADADTFVEYIPGSQR